MNAPADDETDKRLRAILADMLVALERARGTDAEAAAERAVLCTRAAIEARERGEDWLRHMPR